MRASAIVGALLLSSCGVAPAEELLSSPNIIEPAPDPEPATGPRFFGSFTIKRNLDPLNGIASTKIFEPLVSRELSYQLAFEIVAERNELLNDYWSHVETGPLDFTLRNRDAIEADTARPRASKFGATCGRWR